MNCSISGEPTLNPVLSPVSNAVFDRALLETFIAQNGTDPITGVPLTVEELISIKTPAHGLVRPRTAAVASIPSMLAMFQSEWDAITLETFQLRQELLKARQELSTALYQHDAAVRVVARLMKERDEARQSLAQLSASIGTNNPMENSMDVENGEATKLSEETVQIITQTHASLSATRRKRKMVDGWATKDILQSLNLTNSVVLPELDGVSATLSSYYANQVLVSDGSKALHYLINSDGSVNLLNKLEVGTSDQITTVLLSESGPLIGTQSGKISNLSGDLFTNSSSISQLIEHPCKTLIISFSTNGFSIHDLTNGSTLVSVDSPDLVTTAALHPDGFLLAVGTQDQSIVIYNLPTMEIAAKFEAPTINSGISALEFSENGYWLASTLGLKSAVALWDLRKGTVAHTFDLAGAVNKVKFDYSGHFMLAGYADSNEVQVFAYDKKAKAWSEAIDLVAEDKVQDTFWGDNACSIVALAQNKVVTWKAK